MISRCTSSVVTLLLLFLLPILVAPASGQDAGGITLDSDAVRIEIGGRVQTQFNTSSIDSVPASELFLRRVRLELEVELSDLVSGRIQPDFAGDRVSLKDVYLKLDFAPGFQVLTGKAYRPFSLLEQTSSTRILPIERGARIRGIDAFDEYELVNELGYSDRDIGVQVMGEPSALPLGFTYAAGVFRGPLHGDVGNEESYQYAARATVQPIEPLRIGGGWSSRHFDRTLAGAPAPELARGHAFEIDAELGTFAPGLHLLGEVAWGDADPFTGADFFGAQGWVAYRTGRLSSAISAVEPIFRASYGDVDDGFVDGVAGTLLTPGLNVYFGGRNRVMVNYDVFSPNGAEDRVGSFKAMFQLAF